MADLHLNLKGEYFNAIKSGAKPFEYRLKNDYWSKRLVGRIYDNIYFKKGYPKVSDVDKIICAPYRGYEVQTITHPHFGNSSVEVFAIYTDDTIVNW